MVGKPKRKWWWRLMKKQPSLSSRNTLGDPSHHSSNHKCYKEQKLGKVVESYGGLADDMVDGLCKDSKISNFYGVQW